MSETFQSMIRQVNFSRSVYQNVLDKGHADKIIARVIIITGWAIVFCRAC